MAKPFFDRILIAAALLVLAGCVSAPVPNAEGIPVINSYNGNAGELESLASKQECDDKNSLLNRRQIMVTSQAVQSAWFYCLRYADGAYFPEEETEEPVGNFPE
jgi:hypothetical protein